MLDKAAVLNALSTTEKDVMFSSHQQLGKADFIGKLADAINKGTFDVKDNIVAPQEEVKEFEQAAISDS